MKNLFMAKGEVSVAISRRCSLSYIAARHTSHCW